MVRLRGVLHNIMIIDKNIDIEITGYNIRFYIDRFPLIKKGDIVKINQLELPSRSTAHVECICSNTGCGNTYLRPRRNIHGENTYCSRECHGIHLSIKNMESRKKEILVSVQKRIDENKSMRYKDIKRDNPKLLNMIDKYYPLNEIFKDLGYSESEVIEKFGLTRNVFSRTLSVEEIKERLLYLKSKGRLTTSAMRTEFDDYRLEQSIKKLYGGVSKCLDELDLERDVFSSDKSIMMGRKFEELFNNILNEIGVKFKRHKTLPNGCIPDFTLHDKNVIIDTKLSSWTTSIPKDVENYSKYCDKLIIVYLREGDYLPIYNKTKLKSVYYYVDKLPKERKNFYKNEIEKILSYHP